MAEEGTWDRVLQMLIAAADAGGARVIQTIVRHALVAVLTLLATIVLLSLIHISEPTRPY